MIRPRKVLEWRTSEFTQITPSLPYLWKPQSGNDAVEIVGSIILDVDSSALVSVMDCDVGGQVFLQPVL
jgi:hypothetical protein